LIGQSFNSAYLKMALVMVLVETGIGILAWAIARSLRLSRVETGALILVSAFGMSTMLGYPLISQTFSGDLQAMQEAVFTSEFGVGFLLFIFGPLIAMYFGGSSVDNKIILRSAGGFMISPVFISLVLGVAFSFISIPQTNEAYLMVNRILDLIAQANTLMVALAVGLMIELKVTGRYLLFLALAVVLKLLLKPVLTFLMIENTQFTEMMKEIIIIETAMPSAILGAVFAKQYNCNPELVSTTVVVTLIVCVFTVPALFIFLF
ncbi:MAG: AEC family transporter, partial [Bacteroidales bacterium]|nr:AEC family transporter [Bacteroidales bacterium]